MLVLRLPFSDSYDNNNHMVNALQVNYHAVMNIINHVADERSSETSGPSSYFSQLWPIEISIKITLVLNFHNSKTII